MASSLDEISRRLQQAEQQQQRLTQEINLLRKELFNLKLSGFAAEIAPVTAPEPIEEPPHAVQQNTAPATTSAPLETVSSPINMPVPATAARTRPVQRDVPARTATQWEKFIGENLINKIGIAILVIGVAIGAKYAIDNELISPLGRILLGYLAGIGLLVTGFRLFEKYNAFSAVLTSGALSIFYFITYFAYDFYEMIPKAVAFGMMVLFTGFGVIAATRYKAQVIALLGMVGAYGVPFLLSDGSGQVAVLYSYVAIINLGLLYISFRLDWRWIYYLAFAFTWLIFGISVMAGSYNRAVIQFWFAHLFFLQFYAMFLGYKTVQQGALTKGDLLLILANALLCYGIGYMLLPDIHQGVKLSGLYTIAHAAVHIGAAAWIKRRLTVQPQVLWLLAGLGLSFVSLAIPVQLEGSWVTLLWLAEAMVLITVYRRSGRRLFGIFGLALLLFAAISWVDDFAAFDSTQTNLWPGFFWTNLLLLAILGLGNWLWRRFAPPAELSAKDPLPTTLGRLIPLLTLTLLVTTGIIQIDHLWTTIYPYPRSLQNSAGAYAYISSRTHYDTLSILAYLALLTVGLYWLLRRLKSPLLIRQVWTATQLLILFLLLTVGLYQLSELRELFLQKDYSGFVIGGGNYLFIRYAWLVLTVLSFFVWQKQVAALAEQQSSLRPVPSLALHALILWWLSSELLQWMDVYSNADSYKLALSILWGSYSLLLIVLGIYQRHKYWRLAGLGLFSLTLAKLFFYDLSQLTTIGRTIVFVSLGVLLLVASFLYNKYKHRINPPDEAE